MLGLLFFLKKLGITKESKMEGRANGGCELDVDSDNLKEVDFNLITWHIRPYYSNLSYVGGGAFGNVCKAEDCNPIFRRPREIAIKKLYRPFHNGDSARRAYRELKLLRIFEHDNVLQLFDVYTPDKDYRQLENIYFVTSHAGWDLDSLIQKGKVKLSDEQIRWIIYQLLRGLKYLHSGDIIHRDLKPANLALSPDCDLKILDFGLARKVTWEIMTEYVITRYYRPPEVFCWSGKYNQKVDMWSVGCIMAELLTGEILFKGKTAQEQFLVIIKLLGSPSLTLLDKIQQDTSESTRTTIEAFGTFERTDLKTKFSGIDPNAVDFFEKVLVLDPDSRLSVDEALEHPYIGNMHMPEDEPVMGGPVELDEEAVSRYDIMGWKKRIWMEINDCKKEMKAKADRISKEEEEASSSSGADTEQ